MPGLAASNCATLLSNSLKAAWVLPGISDTTLMWTTPDFFLAAVAEATPMDRAIAVAAATARFKRTNRRALILNVITSPLLDPTGPVSQRLRLERSYLLRLRRSVGCGLQDPDRRVIGYGPRIERAARDEYVRRGGKFDRLLTEVHDAGKALTAAEGDHLIAVVQPAEGGIRTPRSLPPDRQSRLIEAEHRVGVRGLRLDREGPPIVRLVQPELRLWVGAEPVRRLGAGPGKRHAASVAARVDAARAVPH